jgi:hypothetical protein
VTTSSLLDVGFHLAQRAWRAVRLRHAPVAVGHDQLEVSGGVGHGRRGGRRRGDDAGTWARDHAAAGQGAPRVPERTVREADRRLLQDLAADVIRVDRGRGQRRER